MKTGLSPGTSPVGEGHAVYDVWQCVTGYAFNILSEQPEESAPGAAEPIHIHLFDYHECGTILLSGRIHRPKPGTAGSEPADFTVIVLELDRELPRLCVYPEVTWDRVAQRAGGIDIDLESFEFSEQFRVWSEDRRFAYAACHGRMMEFLMAFPDLALKTRGVTVAFRFAGLAPPDQLRACLEQLRSIPRLIPDL